MDNEYKNYKADRVLKLLFRALKGESLSVAALADESNVSTRKHSLPTIAISLAMLS